MYEKYRAPINSCVQHKFRENVRIVLIRKIENFLNYFCSVVEESPLLNCILKSNKSAAQLVR